MMKKITYILSAIVLILSIWAVALWLLPFGGYKDIASETRYGVSEGMQLVEQTMENGGRQYVVEDANGNILFRMPLRGCLIDTRFRGGRLRFREIATGREGYVDSQGMVEFMATVGSNMRHDEIAGITGRGDVSSPTTGVQSQSTVVGNASSPANVGGGDAPSPSKGGARIPQADIRKMAQGSPFYSEAKKILQGRLTETDAARRRQILNYCEHLRTAYTTKDIDFLRQVFSDDALIIVGNVVKVAKESGRVSADSRVCYALHTKRDYLARLSKVFALNRQIEVRFSDFHIMRHPTKDGIYGVSLRQRYSSDRYSDDGYLFLLWDFSNPSMPLIHVRTWQPSATVEGSDGVVDISDFNLE